MKSNFKSLWLFALATILFLGNSCKDDENENTTPQLSEGQFSYKGTVYTVSSGIIFDYGSISSEEVTVSNIDLYLTDGTISGETLTGETFGIGVDLYSIAEDGFQNVTLNYSPDPSTPQSFFFGDVFIDLNKDGEINELGGETLEIVGGSITVENKGANNRYRFVLDLALEGGERLQLTDDREYQYEDFSGNRVSGSKNWQFLK